MANDALGQDVQVLHVQEDASHAAFIVEALRQFGVTAYRRPMLAGRKDPDTAALQESARRHLRLIDSQPIQSEFRVFLSYASEDKEQVRLFHLALLGHGLRTAFDAGVVSGIHGGEKWVDWIFDRLTRCIAMAYFHSDEALRSTVVGFEVGFFLERMMRHRVPLIFVLLRPINVEPFRACGVPIIEAYQMSAPEAAGQFIRLLANHQNP